MSPEAANNRQDRAAPAALGAAVGRPSARAAALAAFAAGTLALVIIFWGTAAEAVNTWYGSTAYNHGFLVVPICLYLAWLRRDALARIEPSATLWGLAAMALAAFGWMFGSIVGALFIQQLALVAMIQALFLTIFGWRVTRALLFPLFYLYFAVPFGDFMVTPLQDFTAKFVVRALQLIGVPVFLDGIFISIPNGNFEVAEACAGVRFLVATFALGFLGAHFFYEKWWKRGLFIGLAIGVPIIANGFRAFGIVYIAYVTDNRVAIGVDHIVYGWVFFAFVTVVLLAVGASFRDRLAPEQAPGAATGLPAPVHAGARRTAFAGLAAILVAGAWPAYSAISEARVDDRTAVDLVSPGVGTTWRLSDPPANGWQPRFSGVDIERMFSFRSGERTVDLYFAFYTHQREGAEVVNQRNRFEGGPWTRVGGGRTEALLDGRTVATAYTRLVSSTRGRLVWHWYWVDGRFTANPLLAKLLQARARFLGGPTAAAVIAVAADYEETPADAANLLAAFMKDLAAIGPVLLDTAERSEGAR